MSNVPEGATTAAGEGADLVSAIADAAKNLGINPEEVAYKLDLGHFRSAATGSPLARRTVRILAWKGDGKQAVPRSNGAGEARTERDGEREPRREREREPRREREREPRRERPERAEAREERPPKAPRPPVGAGEPTAASEVAVAWFKTLMEHMDVAGTVTGTGTDERVRLVIEAEKAGRIIGKRGSTLRAIRHILALLLTKEHGELIIDVDVADDRPASAGASEDDRPRRDDGPRKRGGRGRDRDRDRDRDRGGDRGVDRGERSGHDPAKLEALARRAAEKAIETGKTVTINLDLNSYDRRIVHIAVSEIEGVESQSEERDGKKYVQVIPA